MKGKKYYGGSYAINLPVGVTITILIPKKMEECCTCEAVVSNGEEMYHSLNSTRSFIFLFLFIIAIYK